MHLVVKLEEVEARECGVENNDCRLKKAGWENRTGDGGETPKKSKYKILKNET